MQSVSKGTVVTVLVDGSVVLDRALASQQDEDWPIARLASFIAGAQQPSVRAIRRRIEEAVDRLER